MTDGTEETNRDLLSALTDTWRAAENALSRTIPLQPRCKSVPALALKQKVHQALATQWYLGRMPRRADSGMPINDRESMILEDIRRLMKKVKWTKEEAREVEAVVAQILAAMTA